jgi:hypothetical protein
LLLYISGKIFYRTNLFGKGGGIHLPLYRLLSSVYHTAQPLNISKFPPTKHRFAPVNVFSFTALKALSL